MKFKSKAKSKQKNSNPEDKLARNEKLFGTYSVKKGLLIMVLTSILAAMISGAYVFFNQVIMIKLIPVESFSKISIASVYGAGASAATINSLHMGISDIVKNAITLAEPAIIFSFGAILIFSSGAGIAFSQALGAKNSAKATRIWDSNIKVAMILLVIISFILIGVTTPWIDSQFQFHNVSGINPVIYQAYHDAVVNFASQYTMMTMAGTPFLGFLIISTAISNSEGRLKYVVNVTMITNILNIGLSALLIFASLGMLGAALASVITSFLGFILVLYYFGKLTAKNQTNMIIDYKFRHRIIWAYPIEMVILGISSFIKYAAFALILTTQQALITKLAVEKNLPPNFYQALFGAILPIFNLFLSGLNGVNRGTRSLSSYNYGKNSFSRVKQTYYYSLYYGFIYSSIILIIFGGALGPAMLNFLGVNSTFGAFGSQGQLYLIATLSLFFFYNITFAAFTILATGNKVFLSCLMGALQLILGIIFMYIFLSTNDVELFFWAPTIAAAIFALGTSIYMFFFFKKGNSIFDNKNKGYKKWINHLNKEDQLMNLKIRINKKLIYNY